MLNLSKAEKELKEKSYEEIQEETAKTWGSRAAVEAQNVLKEDSAKIAKLASWSLALEYYTEAIEHSASGREGFCKKLKKVLDPFMDKAFDELERLLE
jgi:hypothetical protein